MVAVVVCAAVTAVLMFVDITALDTIFKPTGLKLRTA